EDYYRINGRSNGIAETLTIRRVRANVCPHSAITLALTAESTMNKGIKVAYEGMRAKMKRNFYGRIAKAEFNLFL
ncbi:hypothetical protein, partial [Bacteroides caecimuris]|uniref:hypothetical protein n=1 Tax=Bacteroides caecimuris TaxID=1796613 RepID=UPI0026583BBB